MCSKEPTSMNRNVFYAYVRKVPLGGKITPNQLENLELLLDYKEKNYEDLSNKEFAYILATALVESELQYDRRETAKLRKGKKYLPYYGRGYAQLTWDYNYEKFGILKSPDKALTKEMSCNILFEGMVKGRFTGKKLSDYFNKNKSDPINARRIVNGTDKATLIRDYYNAFYIALEASEKNAEEDVEIVATKTPSLQDPSLWTVLGGLMSSAVAAVTTPYGLGAFVVLVLAGVGYWYIRNREKNAHGI